MKALFVKSALYPEQYPPPVHPEIAFAGRSNVGKSSLINTLVNRKNLARTGSRPGRTQMLNFFQVDDRLSLVDLPGYGFARVPDHVRESWRPMVETYLSTREPLRAVTVILDIRRGPQEDDLELLRWLRAYGLTPLVVLTKSDKLPKGRRGTRQKKAGEMLQGLAPGDPILFSAKTREGREALWRRIEQEAAQRPASRP
ncbi:MAG: ribosome biogenesis GTP-binding protein YihA/YsxC [Desulfobacteraceae bacterium]